LRDPEERKDRMGGMTARPEFGGRKETGGRDFFLSSVFAESMVLGSSSSLCPCAQSFVVATAIGEGCGRPEVEVDVGEARSTPLTLTTSVGLSGNDAGRFEADGAG